MAQQVLLLWITANKSILEELVSVLVFEDFVSTEPFLMWLKGSFNPPDPDGIVLVDNTDLSIRNQDAINNAQQSQSVSHVVVITI
mmetsp:Transcript_4898/g.7281  ORF Transcript_4898/g.7281 Transcript_4898/m.7281 type:complete len:85 (+) Transcript_4898:207-461(+)